MKTIKSNDLFIPGRWEDFLTSECIIAVPPGLWQPADVLILAKSNRGFWGWAPLSLINEVPFDQGPWTDDVRLACTMAMQFGYSLFGGVNVKEILRFIEAFSSNELKSIDQYSQE